MTRIAYQERLTAYLSAVTLTRSLAIVTTALGALLVLESNGDLVSRALLAAGIGAGAAMVWFLALKRQRATIFEDTLEPKGRPLRYALSREPFSIRKDEVTSFKIRSFGGVEWGNQVRVTLRDGRQLDVNSPPLGREAYRHLLTFLSTQGADEGGEAPVDPFPLAVRRRVARVAAASSMVCWLALLFLVLAAGPRNRTAWVVSMAIVAIAGIVLLFFSLLVRIAARTREGDTQPGGQHSQ